MQNISQNIKLARKAKRLTQQQLADELYVTRQAVSNWETGKTMPELPMLEKVAEKLDVDMPTLLYGENTLKGYTEQKVARIIKYWAILILFSLAAEFLGYYALDRVSDYAGYTVFIEYKTYAFASVWYSFAYFFIWIILWRASGLADNYGNIFKKSVVCVSLILAFTTVSFTAFSAMRHCHYAYHRFDHIVVRGGERYEIEDVEYIYGLYTYHDMGWCGGSNNKIIYIDSLGEDETDRYINDIVTRQPLKIERISEEKAVHFMHEYHIEKAPVVVIIRYENAEVLEGIEKISLLEWKIHNFKQHNIFFY